MVQRTCTKDGCTEKHLARGFCRQHYREWYLANVADSCTVKKCPNKRWARGYCAKHYEHWRVHGDPTVVVARRRKCNAYALDEAYFDEIATEAQAYWLGFITADGGIVRSGTKTYVLKVELAACDIDHVRLLTRALGSDKPLWSRRDGTLVGVAIDSRRLVESLERLGVGPRKSLTAEPWDGPAHLMPHYWRGLVDGDGSIFRCKTQPGQHWCLSLIGSRACIDAYRIWAAPICGSRSVPTLMKGGVWRWKVEGGRGPQRLAEALYGNATISLSRKQESANTLRTIDFDVLWASANAARAATMRDAWATGRHPRAKR